jgi:hypothetical protein
MPWRSYYLHQAKVCRSLANSTPDAGLRDRYEKLALEFVERAWEVDDSESDDFLPAALARVKPDSGDASPEE